MMLASYDYFAPRKAYHDYHGIIMNDLWPSSRSIITDLSTMIHEFNQKRDRWHKAIFNFYKEKYDYAYD